MENQYRIDESDPEFQGLMRDVEALGVRRADGNRLDAGETATITRQLLYVKARTFDHKYPMFKARDFIPVSHEVPSGAEQWSYWTWDMYGMAKIVANYATDFPRVDVTKSETIQIIQSLGASYSYTVQDLRRVAFMSPQGGGNLDIKRAAAARRAIEASIDDIAAVGNPDAGFSGFVNNPSVPIVPATGVWSGLTALQIIADMNNLAQSIIVTTNQVEIPDTMLFPLAEFQIITQTPFSTLADRTIATWFSINNPYIQDIDQWAKLNNQNAALNGGRIVCYRRDEEALTLEIPQEFEQFPPEREGLEYTIPCHARIGGVVYYYPLSAAFMDGSS